MKKKEKIFSIISIILAILFCILIPLCLSLVNNNVSTNLQKISSEDNNSKLLSHLKNIDKNSEFLNKEKQSIIVNKIINTSFSSSEQLKLVNLENDLYNYALLKSNNITFVSLIKIIQNFNKNGSTVSDFENTLTNFILNRDFSEKELIELSHLDNSVIILALLEHPNITSETFVEIAKNCNSIPTYPILKEFEININDALSRLILSSQQQIEIIELNNPVFIKELLLYKYLSADALLSISEFHGNINPNNPETSKLIKEAIERTNLSDSQKSDFSKNFSAEF